MSAVARISSPIPGSRKPSLHEVIRRIAVLERAPVFFALPEKALRALARRVRRISVRAGDTVVYQGEPGDTIFFIEHGPCRVVLQHAPTEVAVAMLAEGDLFGEGACMLSRPQQASVYAQSDCALLALDRSSLFAVLGRDRDFLAELTTFARQRVDSFAAMESRAGWGAVHGEGSVVAMYAPRGGAGATCLSLNLVGVLAMRHPGQVILLDLDLPYAHAALLAGLVPASCLARLADAPPDAFEELLLSAILYHPDGPMILAGALRPEEADAITADLITRALAVLRRTFRYIVVDLAPAVSEPVLACLDAAEQVVVVTAPDLSSVKSAGDALQILLELGVPDGRLSVVLNHRSSSAAVERATVERLLHRRVDVEAAFDGARPDIAALKGQILSLTTQRSEIAKAAAALADLLETRSSARIGGSR
jgi:Flp pilus assembly CpaE family ATPase